MRPTETLMAEHRIIESVLECLEAAADAVDTGAEPDAATFERGIEFLRGFADRIHHFKEEENLFPRLEESGVPKEGGPIGCMLSEHVEGRRLIGAMEAELPAAREGDEDARRKLVEHARGYVHLLRAHIQKEDEVLFPIADQVLAAGTVSELESVFRSAVSPEEDRLVQSARELCARWNVKFPEGVNPA